MNKRQRVYRDDVGQQYAQEMPHYTPRQSYHPGVQMPATMAPIGRSIQSTGPLHYGHQGLTRIDTQTTGYSGHPAVSSAMYPSPSTRQSPHSFTPYSQVQASPASTAAYHPVSAPVQSAHPHGGEYSKSHPPSIYTNNASADASPRTNPMTHANITPSSSSSPCETNYMASGSLSQYPSQGAYTYATPPEHHSQLPPPNSTLTGRGANGMMPSVDGYTNGLGLEFGMAEVERQNTTAQP